MEREDHRTGDTTWNNPRTREKVKRTEERKQKGEAPDHRGDDNPWHEPAPEEGFRLP